MRPDPAASECTAWHGPLDLYGMVMAAHQCLDMYDAMLQNAKVGQASRLYKTCNGGLEGDTA